LLLPYLLLLHVLQGMLPGQQGGPTAALPPGRHHQTPLLAGPPAGHAATRMRSQLVTVKPICEITQHLAGMAAALGVCKYSRDLLVQGLAHPIPQQGFGCRAPEA
jgi:hypothetical protein